MFAPLTILTIRVLYLSVITGLTLYLSSADKHVNFKNSFMTCGFSILMGGTLDDDFLFNNFSEVFSLWSVGYFCFSIFDLCYTFNILNKKKKCSNG
jgi:hypothetical protein